MRHAVTPPSEHQPVYDEAGVDLTLIRWTLSMSPAERLQTLQDFVDSITEMRRAAGEA